MKSSSSGWPPKIRTAMLVLLCIFSLSYVITQGLPAQRSTAPTVDSDSQIWIIPDISGVGADHEGSAQWSGRFDYDQNFVSRFNYGGSVENVYFLLSRDIEKAFVDACNSRGTELRQVERTEIPGLPSRYAQPVDSPLWTEKPYKLSYSMECTFPEGFTHSFFGASMRWSAPRISVLWNSESTDPGANRFWLSDLSVGIPVLPVTWSTEYARSSAGTPRETRTDESGTRVIAGGDLVWEYPIKDRYATDGIAVVGATSVQAYAAPERDVINQKIFYSGIALSAFIACLLLLFQFLPWADNPSVVNSAARTGEPVIESATSNRRSAGRLAMAVVVWIAILRAILGRSNE